MKRFTWPILLLVAVACGGGGDGGTGPGGTTYVLTGNLSDSMTGAVPDSLTLTIDGATVPVSGSGTFVKTVTAGPVVVRVIATGYVTWVDTLTMDQDRAVDVHPVRLRPILLLQLVQATAIGAAIWDAQGWDNVAFGNSGTCAFIEGPGFGTFTCSASWLTDPSTTNALVVIIAFSNSQRPITQITWYLKDLDGNESVVVCVTGGGCAEQP